jgi:hypothetical protein
MVGTMSQSSQDGTLLPYLHTKVKAATSITPKVLQTTNAEGVSLVSILFPGTDIMPFIVILEDLDRSKVLNVVYTGISKMFTPHKYQGRPEMFDHENYRVVQECLIMRITGRGISVTFSVILTRL